MGTPSSVMPVPGKVTASAPRRGPHEWRTAA